jgi:hypothetical protein
MLAVLALITGLMATSVLATATFNFVPDDRGANDEPGQKDLTAQASAFDTDNGHFLSAWKWDDTAWSGGNTGDGCSLFSTDGDTNVDYAVCATIGGKPLALISTTVYSCSDQKPDRCTNPQLLSTSTQFCTINSPVTGAFGGTDTQATCDISAIATALRLPALNNATLLNTCSYPSREPNSDPSDCVLTVAPDQTTTTSTQVKSTAGNISDGGSAAIGSSAYDTASLSGNTATAGGTVTFYVEKGDALCTISGATSLGAKTVTNGIVPSSDTYTFATAGTYEFWAVYSGSTGNTGSTSTCLSETVIVGRNATTTSTQVKSTAGNISDGGSAAIGSSAYDTASLSGNTATAGGTVTFYVEKGDALCTISGATSLGTTTVTGGVVADSGSYTFATAGTYEFWAVYSGDDNNATSTSLCGSETVIVNPNISGISTAQRLVPNDTATLTGLTANAGGTITFTLYPPSNSNCDAAGDKVFSQEVTVASGSATTTNAAAVTAEGTYKWVVVYSGDVNNAGVTSACGTESFVLDN